MRVTAAKRGQPIEAEGHTLHSFRRAPRGSPDEGIGTDSIDVALIGPKFDRPDYGRGRGLELERNRRIAVGT